MIGRFFLTLAAVACCLQWTHAVDTLRPEKLRPGMKGYGLSVFKGFAPERFDVEILGVLKNTFPKQDMILIRMSGADLEKHKVIAGMSGSPIYIDGKLIGALAYGWSFENEPLAGVTPIHNMMAELTKNPPPSQFASATAPPLLSPPPMPGAFPRENFAAPRPLLTPLSLSGFNPLIIGKIAQTFQQFGMLPVAAGGATGSGDIAAARPRGKVEPGGAIGVELIRGDLNAVAVGTTTYVEKNRVLAFGHPFFQGGAVEAPAVQAEVHAIMSSLATSFKLATGVGDIGAMVGDWQSCIVTDTKVKARMIPVSVDVINRGTGHDERYAMEVIDNQAFSPLFVQIAIANAIYAASGSSQDTTVRVALSAELSDRTVSVTNTFFSQMGGLIDYRSLAPLVEVFNTPFGHPTVKRVEVKVDATLTRQTAEIKRAYFSKAQVERGETVPLTVALKPFGETQVTRTISISVPIATDSMPVLTVVVMAGSSAPADFAPPDSMDDFLGSIQKRHRSTDLVALVLSPGQGMQYRGKLLKNLPLSVVDVLDDSSTSGVTTAADIRQLVVPTDWVLSGQAIVRVPIRQE